jgi:hypothetical protein
MPPAAHVPLQSGVEQVLLLNVGPPPPLEAIAACGMAKEIVARNNATTNTAYKNESKQARTRLIGSSLSPSG